MEYLVLDIETIPRADLPEGLEEEIHRRVARKLEQVELEPAEADSLIRSTSPFFGRVLCIGLRWFRDGSEQNRDLVISAETEEETLSEFFRIVNDDRSRQVKFVHYNGLGFDIPFLIVRAAHYGISITNRRFKNLRRYTYDNHIDLMMFLSNWSSYNAVSLDVVCQSFGIPSPKAGEVKGNSVALAYEAGNLEAVNEYVMRDVEATFQLFKKLIPYIG
ncbi:MAG: hypothetical protein GXO91_07025 [FCB group bacterium]|nr:hypothetical protein [FCB group bacterium]